MIMLMLVFTIYRVWDLYLARQARSSVFQFLVALGASPPLVTSLLFWKVF